MPQLNQTTALRLISANESTRPDADAVRYPRCAVTPLRQPALINGLRVPSDQIARGRQRRHAPPYDEDKALDAAMNALARDLGVELTD